MQGGMLHGKGSREQGSATGRMTQRVYDRALYNGHCNEVKDANESACCTTVNNVK